MAQVHKIRDVGSVLDHDRRVDAEAPRTHAPVDLEVHVARQNYPPAAASALLLAEAALVFAFGWLAAEIFGVGVGEGTFGPHGSTFLIAAILFPVIATCEGAVVSRTRDLAALWGLRLIAPLSVAQTAVLALYTFVHPTLAFAPSQPDLMRWLMTWFAVSYIANASLNTGFELLFRRSEREGKVRRRAVVFGGGPHGQRFIEALARQPGIPLNVEAFFDERTKAIPNEIAGIPFGGGADDLIAFVQHRGIEEIFVALPWSADRRILEILRKFRSLPASVRLAPESALLHPALAGHRASAAMVPIIRNTPLSPWGQFFKDLFDRTIAVFALIWLAPLLIGIAVAIKLTSPGPILFRQKRLGFNNRPFSVYKFRTMRVAKSVEATLKQARQRDSRVTRVGAFLRKSSLDELPQLFNVLRGDMSLVGPRPHPMWRKAGDLWEQGGTEPLDAIIHEYAARHRVKPGITGWAQIRGYRGETATLDRMLKRVELDIYYIDHWSLWFDISIILRTFVALFRTQNAY